MATHTEIERRTTVLRSPPPPSVFRRISRTFRKAKRDSAVARGFMLFAVLAAFMLQYVFVMNRVSKIGHPTVATKVARAASQASPQFLPIDDSVASAGEHFRYTGSWEHLTNLNDGRSHGTSSRTMHSGAEASFRFTGERVKLFGVKGPNGGYAELLIDGDTYGTLRFYAPQKRVDALLYASPQLAAGPHLVEVIVAKPPDSLPKRRFVNLDGAEYVSDRVAVGR